VSGAVTLHVWRVPRRRLPRVLIRMAADRSPLRRTPGVGFAKLLGTSEDRRFGPWAADPTRWAALIAWDDQDAAGRARLPRWDAIATAGCRLTLHPLASRGTWAGRTPFGPIPAQVPADVRAGPVLALTRARLRATRAVGFSRAISPVGGAAARAPGLLAAFGIGEAPLGWQGTVSVWRESADLVSFAYRHPRHTGVIVAAPARRWYAEELFARFAVLDVVGDADVIGWREDSLR
jgi:hypothetical protein